jgi:hypothetical protein
VAVKMCSLEIRKTAAPSDGRHETVFLRPESDEIGIEKLDDVVGGNGGGTVVIIHAGPPAALP